MQSILRSEIYQQPETVRRFLENETETVAQIGYELSKKDIYSIIIAARGTSDNAARYGQYLFGDLNRLPVALAAPSLVTKYKSPPRLEKSLVIGISQSGESPDIVQYVEEARRQGAPTVAVTNEPGSPLAAAGSYTIELHTGKEQSIAATKTYTAQLVALALLAMNLTGMPPGEGPLHTIPALIQQALESEAQAQTAARQFAAYTRCILLGRGYNYSTTFEVALKIKELANISAEPYSSADFMHGPLALAGPDCPVILLSLGGIFHDEMESVIETVGRQGAPFAILTDSESHPASQLQIPVPGGIAEWLTPIVAVVPGQLLAYHLTLARGLDPDQPRHIQKVTRTL